MRPRIFGEQKPAPFGTGADLGRVVGSSFIAYGLKYVYNGYRCGPAAISR